MVEIIFFNVFVKDGKFYWNDMGIEILDEGENYSGKWWCGKKDVEGNEILLSYKNVCFIVLFEYFLNVDMEVFENLCGVEVGGMIFGGRDVDIWLLVREVFNWEYGVIMMGVLFESEIIVVIFGKEGVRVFNLMVIFDFMSVYLGDYFRNYFEFGRKFKKILKIFVVNYFFCENGVWFNYKFDKVVWFKWMEFCVYGDVEVIEIFIGYILKYKDLVKLFKDVFNKEYIKEDYER